MRTPNLPPLPQPVREVPINSVIVARGVHAAQTEFRAQVAEDRHEELRDRLDFVQDLGRVALERINTPKPKGNDGDEDLGIPSSWERQQLERLPSNRRERRIENKVERKLQKLSQKRVRSVRSRAIRQASPGPVNKRQTQHMQNTALKELKKARRANTISAQEFVTQSALIGANVVARTEEPHVMRGRRSVKRAERRVVGYTQRVEDRTVSRLNTAAKRERTLTSKAVERRNKQYQTIDKRNSRRSTHP